MEKLRSVWIEGLLAVIQSRICLLVFVGVRLIITLQDKMTHWGWCRQVPFQSWFFSKYCFHLIQWKKWPMSFFYSSFFLISCQLLLFSGCLAILDWVILLQIILSLNYNTNGTDCRQLYGCNSWNHQGRSHNIRQGLWLSFTYSYLWLLILGHAEGKDVYEQCTTLGKLQEKNEASNFHYSHTAACTCVCRNTVSEY